MKVFISQPMAGKTEKQIHTERAEVINQINAAGDVVADSIFPDEPVGGNIPLRYLAKSLDLLALCDKAIFLQGWKDARGCRIEHECCKSYGIDVAYAE